MKISVFTNCDGNYHIAGWRHPSAVCDAGTNVQPWIELAKRMEDAKLDMLFIADSASPQGASNPNHLSQTARGFWLEPLTLLSALSTSTTHLGLAATVPTTWHEPYNVARNFASLDHLSAGRAGWNAVTGRNPEDALNFSRAEHMAHDDRYDRAEEFVDVVKGLWDSYDDDAPLRDKVSGQFFDPTKLHFIEHRGKHFSVRGPLSVARPPQGHPVIIQAGTSESGRKFASRIAEVIFTAQSKLADAQAFYADIKSRAASFGRTPDSIKVLPGVSIYVAPTREAAEAKFQTMQDLIPIAYAIHQLGVYLGVDLSGFDPNAPMPDLDQKTGMQDNTRTWLTFAYDNGLTLAQAAMRSAAAKLHWVIVGTPDEVADELELWFSSKAMDGINLLPPHLPGSLDDFIAMVLPILRKRGLFREEYEGPTLRENLGLARPPSGHAVQTGNKSGVAFA
ncbi:MAG TPA: LLM class flavin-dependent oxidoreductase [Sphingobium sp.]